MPHETPSQKKIWPQIGKETSVKSIKSLAVFASLIILSGLISCTPADQQVKATTPPPEPADQPEPVVKKTPRFATLDQALEYLGSALTQEIFSQSNADRFSATVSGKTSGTSGKAPEPSPEEMTRQRAADAMEELDREIARKEGRTYEPPVSVQSQEKYSTPSTTGKSAGSRSSDEPMVIAIADFINSGGNVSKLGRYAVEKLTPYFARSRKFAVMERAMIDQVLQEQKFQVSAFVDEASTQEFGKLVGAETIISGTIAELDNAYYFNVKAIGVATGNLMAVVDVEVDRNSRLAALYHADLPKIKPKKEFQPQIFRASGMGIPSAKHTNPSVARAMAGRAAKADAMRNLAQQIQGAQIDAETTVRDYVTESDTIKMEVNSYIRGARVISQTQQPDGTVEVEMEVEVPAEFFEQLYATQ
jgi:hypothetical protein